MIGMWIDALMCFKIPTLARWTAVVVDRNDGTEYPIASARFRWHRNAETWVLRTAAQFLRHGGVWLGCEIRTRPLKGQEVQR